MLRLPMLMLMLMLMPIPRDDQRPARRPANAGDRPATDRESAPRPPPPRRRAAPRPSEPRFMERNRTDVATLETLRLRIRTRLCAAALRAWACARGLASLCHACTPCLCFAFVLAHGISQASPCCALLRYAFFAAPFRPLDASLALFVPYTSLQMTKSDKKICRNIYVICNITHYNLFSSPLKYLFTKHPISGQWASPKGHRKAARPQGSNKRASPKSASAKAGQRRSRKGHWLRQEGLRKTTR